jgi:O-antigen/teichoic acid export membrane protein
VSLKQKTISGLFWTFSQQFGVQIINLVVSVILARLLMPSDFGLIGMLAIFIGVGATLIDSGLTSSLIRTSEPDQQDFSTVFFINLVGSGIIYLIVFITAPLIAAFYDQPILTSLVRVYSISFIFNAFGSVQVTRLTKEMNFKLQMMVQIPSLVGGGLIGVVLALLGYGVWSLVFMNLFQSFLSSFQLWMRTGWRPNFSFNKERFKYHFNFGYKLTLSSLLEIIFSNAYNLIIGKYFSVAQLGFYTRADTLKQIPVQNVSMALNKVTYPIFSSIQHNNVHLKSVYKRLIQQVLFWLAPVLISLIVVAEPFFRFLLGDKWLPAVPYFQILCGVGIMYPINGYNLNILKVKGRSDLFLRLEIIKKAIVTVGIIAALQFGIYGLLYFQLIFSFLGYFINTWYSGKLINYTVGDQLKDILPSLILSLLVGVLAMAFDIYIVKSIITTDFLRVAVVGTAYFIVYLGIGYLTRMPAILDFQQLIFKR